MKIGHGPATVIGRRCGVKLSTGARRANRAKRAGKDRSGCDCGASSARISDACVQQTRGGKAESQEDLPRQLRQRPSRERARLGRPIFLVGLFY